MLLKIEAEVKLDSDPCVLAWDNQLLVGTEDGCIKSFDGKLSPKESWQAHGVQLFALATGNNYLYSSSNDGGIRVWTLTGQKVTELPFAGADIGTVQVFGSHVYGGDESGNITIYENNEIKASYNVLEEVKDLWYDPPYLFTTRDAYVTVTEIKPEDSKTRFMTRHTMEGRAPLRGTECRLVFVSRSGFSLCLHDSSINTVFEKLHEVKVSDMIVTSLAVSGNNVWSGGWDGIVRKWKIAGSKLEAAGEINLGGCINSLASANDRVYAAVAGGKLVCVS
ncbi:unnamed protein product [Arctia plantaginis]|uniref:Uncharacterized protein n=1 Tax=Arctia plantaginis TaxID=874455 RepID=A0A8S1A1W7_ARCPL|nr:unnamed protein product [Arctia plantaginis]